MQTGYKIIETIERPSREVVEGFRGLPVANIADCMGRIAAVDQSIRPLNKAPLLGTAFTVRVPQGDNLLFHKSLDMAQPGDVIVIDAGGAVDRAIFGELMTIYCMHRGLAGLVVDGAVRDADTLAELTMPVYARGITPNGPYKNGPGEINVPVVVGGKVVFPGDILVGDGDGLVIIHPADALDVQKRAREVQRNEEIIMKRIVEEGSYERPFVDEKLHALGYL